ncbi:MAG TPA: P1 family peptidase [Vicinamibacteria bacterium]|nr:P1 family peptidase [Vicinamibacteria bacterium]
MAHALGAVLLAALLAAAPAPRGRDLGIPFDFGRPGRWNAITDVPGVTVGHVTLVEGASVRTGVTAVVPRGLPGSAQRPCFAGTFSLNGNGEMTGVHWLRESGLLEGPVLITNTNSVGVVRDAAIAYAARRYGAADSWGENVWSLPVVTETWDGTLNDAYGMHVKPEHVAAALEAAAAGPVAEGNVGGGTGMIAFEFKGGIGTASRLLTAEQGGYTVGVLVQANFGLRHQLRIAGVPVGQVLRDDLVYSRASAGDGPAAENGSIIIVVATDAPLLPHQLERLARRAALGLARTGSVAGNGSGDLFVAFSTANPEAGDRRQVSSLSMFPNDRMGALFEATVGATEEAIVNALVGARTMVGHKGRKVVALPHEALREVLRRHGRLAAAP